MFCLMDVSASMDEDKKDLAKRFFTLLYLFLTRKYGEVDLIFIRHTDDAEEVDEETFFHDTRSGGTVVYSALELADKIRTERYASGWNVYAAQASDGDAFGADPAQERTVPARAAAAVDALLHLPRACRARYAGPFVDAVGRVRARRRGDRQFRDEATRRAATRSIPCSASSSRRTRNERRPAPISHGADWDFELLERYDTAIAEVAGEYGLDTYPNQIEIITSEQMLDAYATSGLPVGYPHWSYGKEFIRNEQAYRRGMQGLAYEIVINSNPCIAYLMEENTMATQALVIAHACYGHNSFFKGNHLFRQWTSADAILDYLVFARRYVMECEERHGAGGGRGGARRLPCADAARRGSLSPSGGADATRRRRRGSRSAKPTAKPQFNDLWRTVPEAPAEQATASAAPGFPAEPQENILYFIEKYSPKLEPWQRELVRIVRKLAQYFYPQAQTKVMNEGWATFWHYTILNRLHEKGLVDDGFMLEFLKSHTNVIAQPGFDSKRVQRAQSVRAGLRDVPGPEADLRDAGRRGSRVVSAARRHRLAAPRSISRCATSRTNRSSPSTFHRGSSASSISSPWRTTLPRTRCTSTASTTNAATGGCASSSRDNTRRSSAFPMSRSCATIETATGR